jgi:hypothetical protein
MMQAFKAACAQAGLTALSDDRDKVAEQSFARRAHPHLDDSPTKSTEAPRPAAPSIPAPLPPQPPEPPMSRKEMRRAEKEARRAERRVEWEMNFDNTDWKQVGERIKDSVERSAGWLENIGDKIETAVENAAEGKPIIIGGSKSPEDEIRRRVEKRYKERQGLITNLVSYILINIMMWTIFGLSGSSFPWPIFVTLGWGIGAVSHVLDYNSKYGSGAQRREAEIQREIERERERSLAYEKPKRDPRMRLTADGEIEEVYDDATSRAEKRKNR